MIDLRCPEDVEYAKNLGELLFLAIAGVWLLHGLFKGDIREVKNAVGAS